MALSFPLKTQGRWDSEMHKQVVNDELQWWFVNPVTFVPGRYFRINEISGLLKRPSVQKRKSVPALFVRISETSGLSEPGLTKHHCIFILTFSDFCLQHYQLPLPVICFKNVHYGRGPCCDNLQNAALNSNYHKKVQIPVFSSQCSCYYTLCLFHFLSDIRLISGLIAIASAT